MAALKMDKSIYLISGLGADERVFQRLNFGLFKPHFIKWVAPKNDELIQDYALRLSEQIEDRNPIIVGVSFGGILAIEIAKLIDCQRVILISSAKTKYDIPVYYRFLGQLKLHQLIPIGLFKMPNLLTFWFFGMREKNEKMLLKSILKDTDETFLKWAIDAIVNWKNEKIMDNLMHIHGDLDRILPIKNRHEIDVIIPNSGHLMVFSQADLVNKKLLDFLHFSEKKDPSV